MIQYSFTPATNLEDGVRNLFEIISILRSPEGCPWDRVQTNKTATESLIDESYEYLDSLINKDVDNQREEIGDILINVFMTLYIHQENNDFSPIDALNEVCDKLIRRHKHVFSSLKAETPDDVIKIWNNVKETVEGKITNQDNLFDHIPKSLPPLEKSYEIQKKLKKVDFDFNNIDEIFIKLDEEINELKEALKDNNREEVENEIGDVLFTVVNLSRHLKIKPNTALDSSNRKIINRFKKIVEIAKSRKIEINKENNKVLNEIWEEVK